MGGTGVGATLVVARVDRTETVLCANTGEDKPRPYDLLAMQPVCKTPGALQDSSGHSYWEPPGLARRFLSLCAGTWQSG